MTATLAHTTFGLQLNILEAAGFVTETGTGSDKVCHAMALVKIQFVLSFDHFQLFFKKVSTSAYFSPWFHRFFRFFAKPLTM